MCEVGIFIFTWNLKFIICTTNIKSMDYGCGELDRCKAKYYVLYKLSLYEP